MARTAEITLDETTYVVRPFNIGELEQITDAMASTPNRVPFLALQIALARATPAVPAEQFSALEPTGDQIATGVETVMRLSGMETAKSPPAAGR